MEKVKFIINGKDHPLQDECVAKILYLFQNIPIIKEMKKIEWQKGLSKFIWQDKKPKEKFKVMCDVKERGGMQVPNLKIYFEAVCLAWIKEWMTLDNKKILNLEGFNCKFGWHAYLQYNKYKADGHFSHHYVRQSLLKTWLKYRRFFPKETPPCVVPQEVIMPIVKQNKKIGEPTGSC